LVQRITHLGFEVRVDLDVEGAGAAWAQLTRPTSECSGYRGRAGLVSHSASAQQRRRGGLRDVASLSVS